MHIDTGTMCRGQEQAEKLQVAVTRAQRTLSALLYHPFCGDKTGQKDKNGQMGLVRAIFPLANPPQIEPVDGALERYELRDLRKVFS